MSTSGSESTSDLVLELAEEFLGRYRAGQRPPLREYTERYPDLAGEIRHVFPAMAMMENIALADESLEGRRPGAATPLKQIGDFRVIREVGRGGMGVVYEAEQVSLGRHVALKVLPSQMLNDAKQRRRFEREARAAARLHHSNIVPIFGVGDHDETPYYVMQFIQGQGLDAVLDELRRLRSGAEGGNGQADFARTLSACAIGRDISAADVARSLLTGRFDPQGPDPFGALAEPGLTVTEAVALDGAEALARSVHSPSLDSPPSSSSSLSLPGGKARGKARGETYWQGVARIGAQVADALAYAHGQGVVHRDIKPANLLIDTRGTVWVTDFGLAKADDQQDLTHTGDLLGTLRFMPPESFSGRTDARADVYSLGLTLYEMVAFRPAFDEKDRGRLVKQVSESQPPRLGKLSPDVPRDLETIIHKAIEPLPNDRYSSAGELAADLQRFLDDQPILARRASLFERYARWARHHPEIAIAGAIITALLVALAVGGLVAASMYRQQAHRQFIIAGEREVAARRAEVRRVEAEAARGEAEAARRHAETVVVDMHAARGFVSAERDDAARAMLWFAKAAELALHDPERERLNRIRARAWEREAVVPVLALEHEDHIVTSVAFQPRGRLLATLTDTKKARLWRLDAGSQPALPTDVGAVTSIAWSPDGTLLALGLDHSIRLYRASDWSLAFDLACHGPAGALAFSRDGALLAGGGEEILLWNPKTAEPRGKPLVHPQAVISLEFNARGDRLLTGCRDGNLRVFDIATADDRPLFETTPAPPTTHFAPKFSATGDAVLSFTGGNELSWLDASSGKLTGPGKLTLNLFSPSVIAVSPDGRAIAAGGYYGPQLFPVDPAAGAPRLLEHGNGVTSCQFSPDSKLLVSSSWDRTVRLWSVPGGNLVGTPLPHEQLVYGASFSPDGGHVATWQAGGLVRIWRLPSVARVAPVSIGAGSPAVLRPSHDGRRAIVARFQQFYHRGAPGRNVVRVYDLATGKAVGCGVELGDEVHDAVLDVQGKRVAAVTRGPDDSALYVWDVETGRLAFTPRPLQGDVISVDFSQDDANVATLSQTGNVQVFDARDGRLAFESVPAVSPDLHARLRFASADTLVALHWGRLFVFDVRTGRLRVPRFDTRFAQEWQTALALSEDGRYAAVGGSSLSRHVVRVWDLKTGEAVSPWLAHPDVVYGLAFSPDGRQLVSGGRDGQLRDWNWASGTLIAPPCQAGEEIFAIAVLPEARYVATAIRKMGSAVNGKLDVWDVASGKRMVPSIRVGNGSATGLAVSRDQRRGMAYIPDDGIYAFDLSVLVDPNTRSTSDLVRLGELASGQRILGGDLAGITAEEWLERWHESRPGFGEPIALAPLATLSAPVVRHQRPSAAPQIGWRRIARESLQRLRDNPANSHLGLNAAVYTLLDGDDEGYRETCRIMLTRYATTENLEDAERTAKLCLLQDFMHSEATRLAESLGRRLDAGTAPGPFVPWGFAVRSLAALRNGQAAFAERWAERGAGSYGLILRAMAEQQLGRNEAAKASLERARQAFGGSVSAFVDRAARNPYAAERTSGALPDYLFAALLFRQAEAAIVFDPAFPAQPFAGDAATSLEREFESPR
jgi:WD40 repeat protein/serine/threonine protein kinase